MLDFTQINNITTKPKDNFQDNIRRAGHLRAEILKGLDSGEPIETLFLKAAECISKMTCEELFYKTVKKKLGVD